MSQNYDKIHSDQEEILNYLELCLLEEERVELEINRQVRLFFTHLRDDPPEPIREMDETGRFVSRRPDYEPFSYLRDGEYLLLEPLTPSEGNLELQQSQHILLRFFSGVNSYSGEVAFQEFLTIDNEPAIRVSFPPSLGVINRRRHHRAKTTASDGVYAEVHLEGEETFSTRVVDVSEGGMSFCNPLPMDKFPNDQVVTLVVHAPRLKPVELNAFVRNRLIMPGKSGCREEDTICGVQFDILTPQIKTEMMAIVSQIQRDYLIMLREKRDDMGLASRLTHFDESLDQRLNQTKDLLADAIPAIQEELSPAEMLQLEDPNAKVDLDLPARERREDYTERDELRRKKAMEAKKKAPGGIGLFDFLDDFMGSGQKSRKKKKKPSKKEKALAKLMERKKKKIDEHD